MASRRRCPPPSRARYDLLHPTISVRVSQPLYRELMELRLLTGKSLGDIPREALGRQAPSAKNAYRKGYEEAKFKYAVTYKCSKCGGNIVIASEDEKRSAATFMRERGWHHGQCPG